MAFNGCAPLLACCYNPETHSCVYQNNTGRAGCIPKSQSVPDVAASDDSIANPKEAIVQDGTFALTWQNCPLSFTPLNRSPTSLTIGQKTKVTGSFNLLA